MSPPLSFRRVAVSMIVCALLLAFINLYMNIVSSYSLPGSLQLDLSADGDLVGFHHFPPAVLATPLPSSSSSSSSCAGLCVPVVGQNRRRQEEYVRELVHARMRRFPANTFIPVADPSPSPRVIPSSPSDRALASIWRIPTEWASPRSVLAADVDVSTLRTLIDAITTASIQLVSLPKQGTQLKLLLHLKGGQQALLKPARYGREWTSPTDTPYSGADRHNGEIAAFHLSVLLGLHRVPIAVGRRVNVTSELLSTADAAAKATFFESSHVDGSVRQCFYGKCLYCGRENAVCTEKNGMLETALVLWLPGDFGTLHAMRSPWARTYDASRLSRWQTEQDYCSEVARHPVFGVAPLFLDLMDMAVFDFLIGNADRHRLERFASMEPAMILLLDNGKSFGNAHIDEISILAPLYQCCRIRTKLYSTLLRHSELDFASKLRERLRLDSLYPLLSEAHLEAVNRRLRVVLMVLDACMESHGKDYVLQNDGF